MFNLHSFLNAIIIIAVIGIIVTQNRGTCDKAVGFFKKTAEKISLLFENKLYSLKRPIDLLTSRWSYWVIFTAILAIIIRWYLLNLGVVEFWGDEFTHLYSAKAYSETGKAVLPSGVPYLRSFPYTWLVALSFKSLGISEFTARLPSVIVGIIFLVVIYFSALKLSNKKVAMTAFLLLAIDPLYYWWSRTSRMYVLFALIFFAFILIFYFAFEELIIFRKKRNAGKLILLWSATAILYYLSYYMHPLALLVLPALAVYPLAHPEIKINDKVMGIVVGSSAVLLIVYVLFGNALAKHFVPPQLNIIKNMTVTFFYFNYFMASGLAVIGFSLLGLFMAYKRKDRFFIYISTLILITFVILSTIFANVTNNNSGRFIIHFLPLFYLLAAWGLVGFFGFIREKWLPLCKPATALVVMLALIYAINIGRFNINNLDKFGIKGPLTYKQSAEYLQNNQDYNPEKDIVISTLPMASMYYLGKTDYWLRQDIDKRFLIKKDGKVSEMYSGTPILREPQELKKMLQGSRNVWLLVDYNRFKAYVKPEMKQIIKNNTNLIKQFDGTKILINNHNQKQSPANEGA